MSAAGQTAGKLPTPPQGFDFAEHLTRWWAAHATVLVTVATALLPQAQAWVGAHPRVSTFVAGAATWLAALKASPLKPS
jgi:hypothetical protein